MATKKGTSKAASPGQVEGSADGPNAPAYSLVRLNEVADVNARSLPSNTDPHYQFAYVDLTSVKEGQVQLSSNCILFKDAPSRARRLIRDGDVLMSVVRPKLNGFARVTFDARDVVCSTGFAIISPHVPSDSEYIYHLLFSDHVADQLDGLIVGSNYPAINSADVGNLTIPYPAPHTLRQKIGSLLTAWDTAIQQTIGLIRAKLRHKEAVMRQLLAGGRRFQSSFSSQTYDANKEVLDDQSVAGLEVEFGLTGKSYREGIPRLGDRPDGWHQVRFADVLEVVERPVQIHDEHEYQLVNAKRYRGGIVPRGRLRGRQIKTKTQFNIAAGDFLISRRQIIHGACGIVPVALDGALVSGEYTCLRVKGGLLPEYLQYLSHSPYFQQTCYHASVGVTVEKMIFRLDKWLEYPIYVPPPHEQRSIAAVLGSMDREALLLARQRRALIKQKKGLMQELLTAQIRVEP